MISYYLAILESPEDQELFGRMYADYHFDLERYALSIVKNQHDAEDALHDAFTYVAHRFEKYHKLAEGQHFYWLKNLVRWKSYGVLRKRKRLILVEDWSKWEKAKESGPSCHDLAELFALIPDKYREPLELMYVYGYSGEEVALHMRISENNVYARIFRAKKRLKELQKSGRYSR